MLRKALNTVRAPVLSKLRVIGGTGSIRLAPSATDAITEQKVLGLQANWGNATKLGFQGDYVKAARDATAELYGYGRSNVLFKTTKAAGKTLEERLDKLEEEKDALEDRLTELEEEKDALETERLPELEEEKDALEERLPELEEEKDALEERLPAPPMPLAPTHDASRGKDDSIMANALCFFH